MLKLKQATVHSVIAKKFYCFMIQEITEIKLIKQLEITK